VRVRGNRPLSALTINEGYQQDGKPSISGTMRGDVADLAAQSKLSSPQTQSIKDDSDDASSR